MFHINILKQSFQHLIPVFLSVKKTIETIELNNNSSSKKVGFSFSSLKPYITLKNFSEVHYSGYNLKKKLK